MTISVSEFSRLLDSMYGAVFDHGCWTEVLADFQRHFRSDSLLLGITEPTSIFHTVTSDVSHDFDPQYKTLYDEYYYRTNYLIYEDFRRGTFTSGKIKNYAKLDDQRRFRNSEFHCDYLKPQNIYHVCSVCISLTESVFGLFTLGRKSSAGAYSDDDEVLLGQFVPHLQRAIVQAHCIGGLKARYTDIEQGLDLLPVGVMVLDASEKVLFLNREADRIVRSKDGIEIGKDQRLTVTRGSPHGIRHAIQRALDTSLGIPSDPGPICAVNRPSSAKPFTVMISPLSIQRSDFRFIPSSSARVVVLISDPERQVETSASRSKMRARHGFTEREAGTVQLLSQGKTNLEIAEALGVSENTVRTFIQRALCKTDTRRRGELISLICKDFLLDSVAPPSPTDHSPVNRLPPLC